MRRSEAHVPDTIQTDARLQQGHSSSTTDRELQVGPVPGGWAQPQSQDSTGQGQVGMGSHQHWRSSVRAAQRSADPARSVWSV